MRPDLRTEVQFLRRRRSLPSDGPRSFQHECVGHIGRGVAQKTFSRDAVRRKTNSVSEKLDPC